MKKIQLNKLVLTNFKGIKNLTIDFGKITNIYGDNALGKTSIFDAFFWLLFDKDSANDTKFDVKTLDDNGLPIHHLSHNVTGHFTIDKEELTLSKTYKEKWTKKRGESTPELTGHTTDYEKNGVPITATEYKKFINNLVDEDVFKLLTNPMQFGDSLGWKERREILMKLLGEVSNEEVIANNPTLKPLTEELENKTVEEVLKIAKATKSKVNDRIKIIPELIKENKSKIDTETDFNAVRAEKEELEHEINALESLKNEDTIASKNILDLTNRKLEIQTEIAEEKTKIRVENEKIVSNAARYKNLVSIAYDNLVNQKETLENTLKNNNIKVVEINKKLDKTTGLLTLEYMAEMRKAKEVKARVFEFKPESTVCPTCGQEFTQEYLKDLEQHQLAHFNSKQAKALEEIKAAQDEITERATKAKEEKEGLLKTIPTIKAELTSLDEKIKEQEEKKKEAARLYVEATTRELNSYKLTQLNIELKEVENKLNSDVEESSTENLNKEKIQELKTKLTRAMELLTHESINKDLNLRIEELEAELTEKNEQFLKAEHIEMLLEEFIKTKVNLLQNRINNKFKMVKFKLFDVQVNGGIAETCEAMIDTNGSLVRFAKANSAAKVQAGLDIINTLTEYYQVKAPVFLDNREGVNEIPEVDVQLVNLIVSRDRTLRIEVA